MDTFVEYAKLSAIMFGPLAVIVGGVFTLIYNSRRTRELLTSVEKRDTAQDISQRVLEKRVVELEKDQIRLNAEFQGLGANIADKLDHMADMLSMMNRRLDSVERKP